MKKRVSALIIFVFVLMGTAACKQPVVEMTPGGNENIENKVTEEIERNGETEVKNIEYGSEEIRLEGKKLEQLTVIGADDMYYCNLEENMKMEYESDKAQVLVCKDPVYDITYYVNYGRDYYIYAYRNNEAELAVAIPARDLFCKEGELYFIADTYDRYQFSEFAEGNILKYNPKDGAVTVVADCSADRMLVYPDGICYEEVGEWIETEGAYRREEERIFFSLATGESCSFPPYVTGLRRWKGDWMRIYYGLREVSESDSSAQQKEDHGYVTSADVCVASIYLVDVQGNVRETLQNVKGLSDVFWIGGDFVYYIEQREEEGETDGRSVLRKYGMKTGIHEDVVVLDYPTWLYTTDMILYNGVIYFGNGLRVEIDSGVQCYMKNAEGTLTRLEKFYTDGENLFCMSGGKLWLFEEQRGDSIDELEFIAGVPLEMGTYVYQLCEPGK